MTFEAAAIPLAMRHLLTPELDCLKPEVFIHFLETELVRARRYNYFVSLLLADIQPLTGQAGAATAIASLAERLNVSLRRTDLLGQLGENRLAVVAPHSDLQTARRILARLESDSFVFSLKSDVSYSLRTSYAVYPRDASSLAALLLEAEARLSDSHV
jgi:GGDEF domain-containing protein